MSIDSIITRARGREAGLWAPFTHCFVGAMDSTRRAILFGLYSNGFGNGFAYLLEISTERLLQIVAQYDSSMAGLTADQEKNAIDIAAKYYLDTLDLQIHDKKMDVKLAEISATEDEFDAREAALDADRAALDVTRVKVLRAIADAQSKIAFLDAKIDEETAAQNFLEKDILEKEIAAKKVELSVLEAGARGLDIQLRIVEAGLSGRDLQIRSDDVNNDNLSTQNRMQEVGLEGREISLKTQEAELSGGDIQIQTSNVDASTLEIQNRIATVGLDGKALRIDCKREDLESTDINLRLEKTEVSGLEIDYRTSKEVVDGKEIQRGISDAVNANLGMDVEKKELTLSNTEYLNQINKTNQEISLVPAEVLDTEASARGAEADILKTRTNTELIDSDIADIENRKRRAEIDAISRGVDQAMLDVDIANAELSTARADVEEKELLVKIEQQKIRKIDTQVDAKMVDVRVAELQIDANRVKVQLAEIDADNQMIAVRKLQDELIEIDRDIATIKLENMRYEIPLKKTAQLNSIANQIEIIQAKIGAINSEGGYKQIEANSQISRITKASAEQTFRLENLSLDKEMALHRADGRIESSGNNVLIAKYNQESKKKEDEEEAKIPKSQIEAADDGRDAAIDAAKTMASANIVNTMVHQIGAV